MRPSGGWALQVALWSGLSGLYHCDRNGDRSVAHMRTTADNRAWATVPGSPSRRGGGRGRGIPMAGRISFATMKTHPGRRGDLVAAFADMYGAVESEPGTVTYTLIEA